MDLIRTLLSRCAALFRRQKLDAELDEELHAHIGLAIEENLKRGMPPEQARTAALRDFGGVTQTKESYRRQQGLPFLATLSRDIRFALRQLKKSPAFAVTALLTLALGIGATTAIFSAVEAALLRPLPYIDPNRLVAVHEDRSPVGFPRASVSPPTYIDLKEEAQIFEDVAAVNETSYNLSDNTGHAEMLSGILVTHNLFSLLGVKPSLGRVFLPEEDMPGNDHELLLSDRFWRIRFAADPAILGQRVRLNDEPYTVVGIMPPGFSFPKEVDPVDVWAPKAFTPQEMTSHVARYLTVVGRLRPGISVETANAQLQLLANETAVLYPQQMSGVSRFFVDPLQENNIREIRSGLLMLMAAVGLILLIACANLANLLLSRARARRREFAVRAALGASRSCIVRQLLTESVLLAIGGGMFGILLAIGSFIFLKHLVPVDLSSTVAPRLDLSVLAFAFAVSVGSSMLFGIAPALQSARVDLNGALMNGGRGSVGTRHKSLGHGFVVGEVALSLMLLVGAGLLLKSFWKLRHVDLGFQSDYVLTADFDLAEARYRNWDVQTRFVQHAWEGAKALPGVESVGLTSVLPMTWKGGTGEYIPEGSTLGGSGFLSANERVITPGYLETMKVPLVRGRFFDDRDREDAPRVAIVNQTMAQKLWPNQDAIGKRFKAGQSQNNSPWIEVVGLIKDVKQMGLYQPPRQEVYFPYLQARGNYMWPHSFAIRTHADPLSMANALRGVIASIDPNEPINHLMTMGDIVDRETAQTQTQTILLGVLATLALAMACVGIYGVMAYMVSQRTSEMGLRMALGARRRDVLGLVLWRGMTLALTGVVIGIGSAVALTRLMRSLLFDVSPTDPAILIGVSLLLIAVALMASLIPARRAASIDPIRALRAE